MNGPSAEKRSDVLIVDDDLDSLRAMEALLSEDFDPRMAASGESALQMIKEQIPDALLLDITMPGMSGLEVLTLLRQQEETKNLPVLLVSALADTEDIVTGLEKGANDYVPKPVQPAILLARLNTQLKMGRLVKRLAEANDLLSMLAVTDELTNIPNRRSLLREFESEFKRSLRYDRPLSLLMMDLDNFKLANEQLGHSGGDAVLRQFVDIVSSSLRQTDVLCRYGGEEFVAYLPETSTPSAWAVAERIRTSVEAAGFSAGGKYVFLTVSIGLATLRPGHHKHFMEMIDEADRSMAEAKSAGRNRVIIPNVVDETQGSTEEPVAST